MSQDRKGYMKAYRQTPEYKEKNAARMRAKYATDEGKAYEASRKKWYSTRYNMCRQTAKAKDLEFTISLEFYKEILKDFICTYCGKDISNDGGYLLDRKDSNKGYIESNVTPSCLDCNRRKKDGMDGEVFKEQNKLNGYWRGDEKPTIPAPGTIEAVLQGCFCTETDTFDTCSLHGGRNG